MNVSAKKLRKQLISMNFDADLLEDVDKFNEEEIQRFPNRTSCIEYLTYTALKIIRRVKDIDPTQFKNEMEEIYQQLKTGLLIDYLEKISDNDLKTLFDVINDEYEIRTQKEIRRKRINGVMNNNGH